MLSCEVLVRNISDMEEILNKSAEQILFERKKTKYFSDFAQHHMREMRILKEGGVLGQENNEWRNVAEHCLMEAVGADVLAEKLGANREHVVQAALLHDWFKRREIESMRELGAGAGHVKAAAEDVQLLEKMGVSPEIIEFAHNNILTSLDSVYLSERTLEERIMHYIDAVTRNTEFVSVEARFSALEQKQQNIDFSNSFINQYAGRSLYSVQREFAQKEQDEFEEVLRLPKGTLLEFINNAIIARIESQEDFDK